MAGCAPPPQASPLSALPGSEKPHLENRTTGRGGPLSPPAAVQRGAAGCPLPGASPRRYLLPLQSATLALALTHGTRVASSVTHPEEPRRQTKCMRKEASLTNMPETPMNMGASWGVPSPMGEQSRKPPQRVTSPVLSCPGSTRGFRATGCHTRMRSCVGPGRVSPRTQDKRPAWEAQPHNMGGP